MRITYFSVSYTSTCNTLYTFTKDNTLMSTVTYGLHIILYSCLARLHKCLENDFKASLYIFNNKEKDLLYNCFYARFFFFLQ